MSNSNEIKNFTDLKAWQESHKLVISVYLLTKKFPKDELFSLTSQIRRSAISITSNIAEGFGRRTFKDKAHFYYQGRGSISELRNQLLLSRDISYISGIEYEKTDTQADTAHKLLQGLINKTNSFSNL
jgi:four helix bundle protein